MPHGLVDEDRLRPDPADAAEARLQRAPVAAHDVARGDDADDAASLDDGQPGDLVHRERLDDVLARRRRRDGGRRGVGEPADGHAVVPCASHGVAGHRPAEDPVRADHRGAGQAGGVQPLAHDARGDVVREDEPCRTEDVAHRDRPQQASGACATLPKQAIMPTTTNGGGIRRHARDDGREEPPDRRGTRRPA
jgi:hypothetical protein